jgi:hypothetical protein
MVSPTPRTETDSGIDPYCTNGTSPPRLVRLKARPVVAPEMGLVYLDPGSVSALVSVRYETPECEPLRQTGVYLRGQSDPEPTFIVDAPVERVARLLNGREQR